MRTRRKRTATVEMPSDLVALGEELGKTRDPVHTAGTMLAGLMTVHHDKISKAVLIVYDNDGQSLATLALRSDEEDTTEKDLMLDMLVRAVAFAERAGASPDIEAMMDAMHVPGLQTRAMSRRSRRDPRSAAHRKAKGRGVKR